MVAVLAIGLGLAWAGYAAGIWGYCLVRGYDVTFRQCFAATWPGAAPAAGEGTAAGGAAGVGTARGGRAGVGTAAPGAAGVGTAGRA